MGPTTPVTNINEYLIFQMAIQTVEVIKIKSHHDDKRINLMHIRLYGLQRANLGKFSILEINVEAAQCRGRVTKEITNRLYQISWAMVQGSR